ncbi:MULTISPECIES: hypothetical protein [Cyanophyceae]|jgi:hypothetical protein|uniref:hypothetical protein n=1 Tax=Cyanophyceae TaxID=3028117 RepID=UPI00016DCA07|nr:MULTISPECIES: hypothetical protein [Cyanophyceae]ACA99295.1 hypothetical protein SYNPCC7002_A1298 [Picosynechococcus sp. PCC 7002]SMH32781.1 hypothetical protein SAMN06272755_0404 [Picosynechococcus sp. OG1]SMQ84292.1 hypothetical protein SAMN06272774_2780 [Synechococcus sp. 7002]
MKPFTRQWVLLGLIPLLTLGSLLPTLPAAADPRRNNTPENSYEYYRYRWDYDDDDDWDDYDDDDDDRYRYQYRRYDWRDEISSWDRIFNDIDRNYNSRIPRELFYFLRRDQNLRRSLFQTFGLPRGNDSLIRDIILGVLFDRNYNNYNNYRYQRGFDYGIDASCLPARWRQEYYRGNPVPPYLLRQCGRVRSYDYDD